MQNPTNGEISNNQIKPELEPIEFPIVYGKQEISKEYFYDSLLQIRQKFNLDFNNAYNLISDMIKSIISANEPPTKLTHLVNTLTDPDWGFLSKLTIVEVIKQFNKNGF